jgi:cobyrinic acid a,c-diamide synthase
VRRGDTFPGLGPSWLRVAVRSRETSTAFAADLGAVLDQPKETVA